LARITKSHGDQGKKSGIVKLCLGHPQPVAELLPTGVVPRNPALVHLTPRRLPDDGDPAPGIRGHNGPWPQGQIRLADPAGPYLGQEFFHASFFLVRAWVGSRPFPPGPPPGQTPLWAAWPQNGPRFPVGFPEGSAHNVCSVPWKPRPGDRRQNIPPAVLGS